MGYLRMLLNVGKAEGIREAMRIAYRKHASRGVAGEDPHEAGLFGALASRYAVRGLPASELFVWAELSPFLLIREPEAAVEAVAEYAVFKERPLDAKVDGLRFLLSTALHEVERANLPGRLRLAFAYEHKMTWLQLVEPEAVERIKEIARSVETEIQELIDRDSMSGETSEVREVIESAISQRSKIRFLNHSSSGVLEEVVSPREIRHSSGQDILIATSLQTGQTASYPLALMTKVYHVDQ